MSNFDQIKKEVERLKGRSAQLLEMSRRRQPIGYDQHKANQDELFNVASDLSESARIIEYFSAQLRKEQACDARR